MSLLITAARFLRRTMGRVVTTLAFVVVSMTSVSALASPATEASLKTEWRQSEDRQIAGFVPTDVSINIDLGHGLYKRRGGHRGSTAYGKAYRHYGQSRRHHRSNKGYYGHEYKKYRDLSRHGRARYYGRY